MDLKIKNSQRQMIAASPAMQQAFFVLQMPHCELTEWMKQQVEQNPLLECSYPIEEEAMEDSAFIYSPSLFDHLMAQARERLPVALLPQAEEIIGSLNDHGFLGESVVDEAVLRVVQTFDPPGIAARDLQQSLLLQLEQQGKKGSLTYRAIANHFEDLLHNRLRDLEKKLATPLALLQAQVRKDLDSCRFNPASSFQTNLTPPLVPDVIIQKAGERWIATMNELDMPELSLTIPPLDPLTEEERLFIRKHATQGKWLLRMLRQRNTTILRIAHYVIEKQPEFFHTGPHKLLPMKMHETAAALGMHESTIARATAQKYVATPHGIFRLRDFFSRAVATRSGKNISNRTVKGLVQSLIAQEDKHHPLSDDTVAEKLSAQGIRCARRTVTKYRKLLHLPSAHQRKKWE